MNPWLVGWGMVPRGEVGLIFAMVGKKLGVMSEAMFSVIVIMVILTTLLTPPIGAAESLRARMLDRTRLAAGQVVSLPNGAAEITFDLSEAGGAFRLEFDHPEIRLAVAQHDEGLEILHGYLDRQEVPPGPRYLAKAAGARRLRVFLDYGSLEVFADGGRVAPLGPPAPAPRGGALGSGWR